MSSKAAGSESLNEFVMLSLIGHVIILLFFGTKAYFMPDDNFNFETAIKVDMVALPDKVSAQDTNLGSPTTVVAAPPSTLPVVTQPPPTEPPAPPMTIEKSPPPTVATKKVDPDAINLEKSKNKQKQALNKLKELSAFEKLQELERMQKLQKLANATPKLQKGNVISPGTALSGLAKLEADQYLSQVDRHIRQHWALPQYLRSRGLTTAVLVKFDEQGNILSKEIVTSSGNSIYDEIVLAAVQKSSPVPAPPGKFVGISSLQGFLFRFSE